MLFQSISKWGSKLYGGESDLKDPIRREMGQDFELGSKEFDVINRRIQGYLRDDESSVDYDRSVDDTLRLIMDETGRWGSSRLSGGNGENEELQFAPSSVRDRFNGRTRNDNNNNNFDRGYRSEDDYNEDIDEDDLLGYCLRLEENNSYLLDIVQRFDEISFQKKYHEVSQVNEQLSKEVDRLKTTNGKIYTSYCDLVDEVKRIRSQRANMNNKDKQLTRENEILRLKLQRLEKLSHNVKKNTEPVLPHRKSQPSVKPTLEQSTDDTIQMLKKKWPEKRLS